MECQAYCRTSRQATPFVSQYRQWRTRGEHEIGEVVKSSLSVGTELNFKRTHIHVHAYRVKILINNTITTRNDVISGNHRHNNNIIRLLCCRSYEVYVEVGRTIQSRQRHHPGALFSMVRKHGEEG